MPASSYPRQLQSIPPPAPPRASAHGRYPLTDAIHHNQYQPHQAAQDTLYKRAPQHDVPPPVPEKQPQNVPASPPLPRQNAKVQPPSPPQVICDKSRAMNFKRVGFLGEGGFARVYEVQDSLGSHHACKVVTKDSLKTKKAKTKLYAEIKIHRSLDHPNIVKFNECFEDEANVYMTLGLCTSGSLMDMLRRRRKFSEPESRFFMIQLIGACHYMHEHQVIHRDLKLGNLFLDGNMNVKVGDFGLAALIENPGERKKTICGTPNYIAPEVLFDVANGHSFEVDTWSIGVILYTLVVGKPPFQTKDVKTIYKRIRDNEYEFPPESTVSSDVRSLVQAILTPDPSERPPLLDIADDTWFTNGLVPGSIPNSAREIKPDFSNITRSASRQNLIRIRKAALLDEEEPTSIALPGSMRPSSSAASLGYQYQQSQGYGMGVGVGGRSAASSQAQQQTQPMSSSLAQQEKEFQKAVQPGSPISALLSSARQPLLVAPANAPQRETSLFRKLQAAKKEQHQRQRSASPVKGTRLAGIGEEAEEEGGVGGGMGLEREEMMVRNKELESQKATIVAQMAPPAVPTTATSSAAGSMAGSVNGDRESDREREVQRERENRPPVGEKRRERVEREIRETRLREKEKEREMELERQRERELERQRERELEKQLERQRERELERQRERELERAKGKERAREREEAPPSGPKLNTFDAAAHTLSVALEAQARGRVFRDPREDAEQIPEEKIFIVSWVDYCNKYGMGYALTDGTVGVHFNDSTSIVLAPDKHHFDYISARRNGTVYVRKPYTVSEYPEDMKNKIYLLKHFERYIMDRLYGEHDYTFENMERTKGMHFVQKYLRMKNLMVFKMSHDAIQFNFHDHSKIIFSSSGLGVTHIDKNYVMTRWTLSEIMAKSLLPPVTDPAMAKLHQRLMDKIKFCKEVLISIKNAAAQGAASDGAESGGGRGGSGREGEMGLGVGMGDFGGGMPTISAKPSKTSLR